MNALRIPASSSSLRRVTLLLTSVFASAACVSTPAPTTPPRVEVQQDVGFTIVEQGRVDGRARVDYDQALQYLNVGQNERGIALLESVVAGSPHLAAPWIDLGIARHRNGDLEAAERALLRALETSPDHPIAHNELGIIYRKTARFAEARARYRSALVVYPGYHVARRNLAVLCDLYLGDLACARDNYEAYMASVKSDEEVSIWLADLRMRMDSTP